MTERRSKSIRRPGSGFGWSAGLGFLSLVASLLAAGCAHPPPAAPMIVRSNVLGETRTVVTEHDDTLTDLARRYDIGFLEIVAANPGVDPWLPGEGSWIAIPSAHILPPAPPDGIVINLAEQRLYYYARPGEVVTHPIGVSRDGYETPLGTTRVVRKKENPIWWPTRSARAEDPTLDKVVPPGPDNPLGTHALYLDWPQYLVHGTNEPDGVGRLVSRGCIRLFPEDIASLYPRVATGTPVRVIDEPVKLGWHGDALYLEAHPTPAQTAALEAGQPLEREPPPDIAERVRAFAGAKAGSVDWTRVSRALDERRGMPVEITRRPPPERAAWFDTLYRALGGTSAVGFVGREP